MSGKIGTDPRSHKSVEWYTPKWIFDELGMKFYRLCVTLYQLLLMKYCLDRLPIDRSVFVTNATVMGGFMRHSKS